MKINEIKNILKIEKSTKWKVGSLKRSQIWTNLSYIEQEKWNRKKTQITKIRNKWDIIIAFIKIKKDYKNTVNDCMSIN